MPNTAITPEETKDNTPVKPVTATEEKPTAEPQGKAPKARSIEVLETVAPTAMTRNEAMKYIKFMREENMRLQTKIKALEENVKSAFAKADLVAKSTHAIEQAYVEQLDYALSSLANVKTAIEHSAQIAVTRVSSIKKGM